VPAGRPQGTQAPLAQDAAARQRFLREARAVAALRHDHVVTIYEAGEADGPAGPQPFLAMELLEGASLEVTLARRPPALAEAVRIGRELAEGLAAAHQSGLIHRDVKPDNIWLEARPGEPGASATGGRVKLLDFGLARAVRLEAHLTERGVVVGTPAYMAPEQAAGREVDARADLFSLGCVLYRLCTGWLAFPGGDLMAVLMALATRGPVPVRRLNPAVPPALADLIHRLLARAPADRPASAQAVAAALRTVEEGLAAPRRPAAGRRLQLGFLAGVAGLLLLVGAVLLRSWAGSGTTAPGEQAVRQDLAAPGPAEAGDGSGYATVWREDFENVPPGQFPESWVRANNAWEKGNGVEEGPAAQGKRSLRLFGSLEKMCSGDVLVALPPHVPGTLRFWIRQGDEPARPPTTHALRGLVLIGPAKAWDDEEPGRAFVYPDGVLTFMGAGTPLAAHRWREVVHRYDRVGAEAVCTYWVDAAFVGQAGHRVGDRGEPTQLWLMAQCGSLWFDDVQLLHDADTPQDRAVTAGWVAAVRQLREQPGPAAVERLRAFAEQYRAAPAQRHRQLAQAAEAQVPAEVAVLAPAATLTGHTARITYLAWAPAGQTLGSTAHDGTARLWRRDGTVVRQLGLHPGGASGLAFAPDGRHLATAGRDGVLRVYRAGDGEEVQTVQGQVGPPTALGWALDGQLLTGGQDGAVRAWDLAQGKPVAVLEQDDPGPVDRVLLSADGRRRLTVGADTVFLDGRQLARRPQATLAATLAPDGTRAAALPSLWEVVVWDASTRRDVLTLPHDGAHLRLAWGPDGRWLALARGYNRVELRDAATGQEVARLLGTRAVMALAFAPDGQTLATGDLDGVIRLWDLRPLPTAREGSSP
jgi:WD40 repeat protein